MYILSRDDALAAGGERIVFAHPDSSDLLIKVISPRYIDYMNRARRLTTKLRRLPYYWFYINELVEHVSLREANVPDRHFIQDIVGLVDTNLGLGMVVRAIRKRDGGLADSLSEVIDGGQFTSLHRRALVELLAWIESTYVIIRDLTARNIVWDECGQHFVVIDGIGARYLPSLRTVSRNYNQRSNRKKAAKLRGRVNRQLAARGCDELAL